MLWQRWRRVFQRLSSQGEMVLCGHDTSCFVTSWGRDREKEQKMRFLRKKANKCLDCLFCKTEVKQNEVFFFFFRASCFDLSAKVCTDLPGRKRTVSSRLTGKRCGSEGLGAAALGPGSRTLPVSATSWGERLGHGWAALTLCRSMSSAREAQRGPGAHSLSTSPGTTGEAHSPPGQILISAPGWG